MVNGYMKTVRKKIKKSLKKIKAFLRKSLYFHYYEHKEIKANTVMYQAYRPKIMSGNPYAIFKELIHNPQYKNYTHYWIYGADKVLEAETCQLYKNHPNVKFIKASSREYLKVLATSEYLINNAALPNFWIKKEGQTYINTWHGVPLKSLGKFAKDRNSNSITNAQRNFLMCDYLVMPNQYTIDKMLDSYDIRNIFRGTIIDAGYPRVDLVLHTDRTRIISALERKIGESLEGKKIVVYAPTFRSVKGKSVNSSNEVCQYVEEMSRKMPDNYVIFFKIHNMLSAYFASKEKMKQRLVFDEIDTNELLSVVDVLITDYSSVFFDYLCTRKPILFFVYDRAEYETKHGLYIPLDQMPGALCYTVDDLIENIKKIDNGIYDYEENYSAALTQFAYLDDGCASKRCTDIIFTQEDKKSVEEFQKKSFTDKKKLLLHVGKLDFQSNRNIALRILKTIDYSQYEVCVCGTNLMHFSNEFGQINSDIKILCSPFSFGRTVTEAVLIKLFKKVPGFLYERVYRRQYERLFGGFPFDVIINLLEQPGHWDKMLRVIPCQEKILLANYEDELTAYLRDYKQVYSKIYVLAKDEDKDKAVQMKSIDARIETRPWEEFISPTLERRLRVLFISAFDSTNYVFVNIIKELKRRGHFFTVIVNHEDDYINNKVYIKNKIPFISVQEYNVQELNDVDYVFAAPLRYASYNKLYNAINRKNKFIITFANLFSSIVMRVTPDLCFCSGQSKIEEFEKYALKYNLVAVGNPQYDALITAKISGKFTPNKHISKVLIIDQGGYPFGKEGKKIWGNVIVQMAVSHPDIKFVVKPRYVPDESGKQLHKLSEHLYDYIVDVPDNLELLMEATILEKIITKYDAAVTTWSTAFLDAAVLDMPLLLVKDIPSVDVFDVRKQRVEEAYESLEKSGCVVSYTELLKGKLPFSRINREFLKNQLYSIEEPCSPKVVDVLEIMYGRVILQGKRFQSYAELDYDTFEKGIENISLCKLNSKATALRKLYRVRINNIMQQFVYESRCYGNVLNLSTLRDFWEYEIDEKTTNDDVIEKLDELRKETERIKEEFFTKQQDVIYQDPILEDYYMQWLYKNSKYDEILNYAGPKGCPESHEFYLGLVAMKNKQYDQAAVYFAHFEKGVQEKEVLNLAKDRKIPAGYFTGQEDELALFEALFRNKAYMVLERLSQLPRYKKYLRVYYLMLMRMERGEYDEAIQSYEQSNIANLTTKVKSRNREIRQRNEYAEKCKDLYENCKKQLQKI